MPYIRHDKASNPFTNLYKEYKGLWWQEHVIRFMANVKLPSSANKPISAYRALASSIRADLVYLHDYFNRLATAMELWCDAWESADSGSLQFVPSRSHKSQEVPINLGFTSLQKP
jgi:reversibly glycosylated polypeptide/UDP-arabinopyranose mutase